MFILLVPLMHLGLHSSYVQANPAAGLGAHSTGMEETAAEKSDCSREPQRHSVLKHS